MAGEVQKPESKPLQRPKTLGLEAGQPLNPAPAPGQQHPPVPTPNQPSEPVQTTAKVLLYKHRGVESSE